MSSPSRPEMPEEPPERPSEDDVARKAYRWVKFENYCTGWITGYARGQARMILKMLELRGFVLSKEQREQVTWCDDDEVLEKWTGRVMFAPGVDEFFAE